MKTKILQGFKAILFFIFFTFSADACFSQGRIVINEYMPWTLNGCGTTAEFVELLNFGPGPVDIGGYILTDGDYSVTIPANTILQPNTFFLIAGQDVLPAPCSNIDSLVHAQLNWNTCGCTSAPIPAAGDGFFTDGGGGNEQIVLLDRNLKIIDAVVRSLPAETSSLITTKDVGFGIRSFNLDTMSFSYEILGMSTGRGNSFARRIDGDCGWVKDPQQSGHATNNTPGETASVTYSMTITKAMDCDGTGGSVVISVNADNYSSIFPMNYLLAYDSNNNGEFDVNDEYTEGIDDTPSTISITDLPAGRYQVTVSSVLGCNLQTFDFTILSCLPVLPVRLDLFKRVKTANNIHHFEYKLYGIENVKKVTLEKSKDNNLFAEATAPDFKNTDKGWIITRMQTPVEFSYSFYRLRITKTDGTVFFSPVLNIHTSPVYVQKSLWPNPVKDNLHVVIAITGESSPLQYIVYNILGEAAGKDMIKPFSGTQTITIPVQTLPAGHYRIIFQAGASGEQLITLPFVKQ